MSMQKYTRAITGRMIGLVFTLSLAANCVYAADPVTTSALDEIGQQYELNNAGDVFLSFDINNKETTVAFTVKPLGDKGDLALIYSGRAEDGVNSLICRLTAQCRGEKLKASIGSFINAAYAFSVAQQKNAVPADVPAKKEVASAATAPTLSSTPITTEPLVLHDSWIISYANSTQFLVLFENTSGKPIKAFRVTVSVLDDFGEVMAGNKIEFTGTSNFLSKGGEKESGHIIQPGDKIYYCTTTIDEIDESEYYSGPESLSDLVMVSQKELASMRIDKKLILKIDKIVFADN